MRDAKLTLDIILLDLRAAESHEEQEAIGRDQLASLLFHHAPAILETVLKRARSDSRLRRALSASRYYCGLPASTCSRIDELLHAPFPAAGPDGRPPKPGLKGRQHRR